MKKNQKILNLFIILPIILFSTVFFVKTESFATPADIPAAGTTAAEKTVYNDTGLNKMNNNSADVFAPEEKTSGFKDIMIKFLSAMSGVLVSSLAIFLGLKFYKKSILKNNAKFNNIDYDKTLDSPKDFKEAINLFLDKTNK